MRIRNLILVFGIVNACLYSALLPLWEGFDEAFHFSNVEALWQTRRLPVMGRSVLMQDVVRSFDLAPNSYLLRGRTPQSMTFEQWFALPVSEKEQLRRGLDAVRPSGESGQLNYEAHHPPLAYLTFAALDWPMSNAPLTTRVLILRLFAAVTSVLMLFFGAGALCRALGVPGRFRNGALFAMFCSQILYATIAHVANDWLAVGLSALFLASLAELVAEPSHCAAWRTAVWLALGLTTKAYFLVFALIALSVAAILIWRRGVPIRTVWPGSLLVLFIAGPWYLRNLLLYKTFSDTYEASDGIGLRQAIAAARKMNWPATIGFLASGSLWTGNNTFTSFSRLTLNFVLALLMLSFGAWVFKKRLMRPAETVMGGVIVIFSAAVAYASAANFAHMHGTVPGASPWYTQVLLAPLLALAFLGLSRWGRWGKLVAACAVLLWTWILIATWTIKLFPMYSGAGAAPMRARDIPVWYAHRAWEHIHDLSLLALAPGRLLYAGLALSLALAIGIAFAVIRKLLAGQLTSVTNANATFVDYQ